jgi:predicted nucleic acid-binding Zn ribbon protein
MLEEGPSVCERCGGQLRRVLYPTGIIFKGSGFYRTDSRSDGTTATETKAGASEPTKAADAKPKPAAGETKKESGGSET